MSNCLQCNTHLTEDARFCYHCGAPVTIPKASGTVSAVHPILIHSSQTQLSPELWLEWMWIPKSEFMMGSPLEDEEAFDDEKPQHFVLLPDYHISKYPITNQQYALFLKTTGRSGPPHWIDNHYPAKKENHPVSNITWHEATAFCDWASITIGATIRLPTEKEWEKAGRGIDGRTYPWGNDWREALCNSSELNLNRTTPVDLFAQTLSPYGVADLVGNVWEWTNSWYKAYPGNQDRFDDAYGEQYRVLRGGSWFDLSWYLRLTYRDWDYPNLRNDFTGFRCVKEISQT